LFNKHYTIRCLLVAVFCVVIFSAKAQLPDYHLQLFDYTSGILPGGISTIIKDKKSVLWILYDNQVQRFDGQQLQTFKPTYLLEHIYCDTKGRVWVSSKNALYVFSDSSGVFDEVTVKKQTPDIIIGSVLEIPRHNIALITSNGVYEYDSAANSFGVIKNLPALQSNLSTNTAVVYNDYLFVHTDEYVYRYNFSNKHFDSLPAIQPYGIYPVTADSVLISPRGDIVQWYDFKQKKITEAIVKSNNGNASFSLRNAVPVTSNSFLLASSEGILEFDRDKKEFFKRNFFINGRKVATNEYATALFYDQKEGYAWIATTEGVARFAVLNQLIGFVKIKQLNDEISANIDDVRRITEDKYGNLWTATGYGFACWEKKTNKWKLYPPAKEGKDRLTHESIRGIGYDGKFLILGPTNTGIWLFNPETERYSRPTYNNAETKQWVEKDYINDIITLHNGNHLIAGRDAFYELNGKTYQLRRLSNLHLANEYKTFTVCGPDGKVWIGAPSGLYYMDGDLATITRAPLPENYPPVNCSFITENNTLLFSCTKGLFTAQFKNDSLVIAKKTDVFDNMVLAIIYQDRKGILWACSDSGIIRYDPVTSMLNTFDYADNVQGYTFNGNSFYRDKDGTVYFGGTNGLNYWQPETFSAPAELFNAYIRKVRIGNIDYSSFSFNKIQPVKYSERSIDVVIGAAYFNNQSKVKYRYKLEGVDLDWKEIGSGNLVRFTSLSPGRYTLKVQASLNQVNWKDAQNELSFQILPPFWLTWWFIGLCILALATAVFLILRNHRKKILEKQEELEAEQAINYFSSSMYAYQSVDTILWDVARNCISRLYFEDCVIYLFDEERKTLVQKAAYGPKTHSRHEIEHPLEIPLGKGITGSVALSGKAEIVNDTSADPRYIVDDAVRYSEITVPIMADETVLGVIDCEHSKKGFFTQRHLFILTTIASLCASKIAKAKVESQKQEAERILRDTQQKMAEIEMQALRAQMNPHFIFNCLNSINRYIVKSDQATASLYLTRFAKLIRLILDNSNNKSVSLNSELEALKLYIEMESIRFEKQFTYSVTVDKNVQPDYINVPPLIIQPFVENAIWHGLLHKETAGHLNIHFSRKIANILMCIIEDDGVGREKAKELKSKSTSTKKSLGMKLTEDRLSLLNRQTFMDATVEVLDLKNREGEPTGTKVVLKIPVDAY
jgi:ligand-binding sensor domain-containing protein/putative methionine-R-sulfoxide reductase with GAF domain